jgi:hypothetical protein
MEMTRNRQVRQISGGGEHHLPADETKGAIASSCSHPTTNQTWGSPRLYGGGSAQVPGAGLSGQVQNELALAARAYLAALARIEVDQARRRQRPLTGARAHQQLTPHDKHECVLVHLVLVQDLALGQQKHDDAIDVMVGTQDLRMVRRDTQTIYPRSAPARF